jgi:hypothetical protein
MSDAEILAAVERLKQVSPAPILALALFYVLVGTGLWQLEAASLQVRTVMARDGELLARLSILCDEPGHLAGRIVFLRSAAVRTALEGYLVERIRRRQGMSADASAYRGLDPASPLFLDERGRRLPVVQVDAAPGARRRLCRGMHQLCRQVFRNAGIPGLTVELCRRSLAWRLATRGATHEQIAVALGVRDTKAVRALLWHPAVELSQLCTDLVP